jgi:hypothetical protein
VAGSRVQGSKLSGFIRSGKRLSLTEPLLTSKGSFSSMELVTMQNVAKRLQKVATYCIVL